MSALIEPEDLAHESELVWVEDPNRLDYVRQTLYRVAGRNHLPAPRLLARPHDRDQDPHGIYATGAPGEAVDPRTLRPGTKGYQTERSEGGPASDAMRELGIELPRT